MDDGGSEHPGDDEETAHPAGEEPSDSPDQDAEREAEESSDTPDETGETPDPSAEAEEPSNDRGDGDEAASDENSPENLSRVDADDTSEPAENEEDDGPEPPETDDIDPEPPEAKDDGPEPPAVEDSPARTDGSHAESEVGVPEPADDYGEETGDEIGPTQPPDDEEMPLTEHVEEMINRLAVVLFMAAIVTLAVFPLASGIIENIWYDILPQQDAAAPHVYGPLELILTELKLSSLAGLIIALPVFVYQTYLFMRPGLYPQERRYYLAAVPTSLVLALFGVAFAYFLILPGLFEYFMYYSDVTAEIAFGLRETFDLILTMMGLLAVVFQIPLFVMLAIMMGVTTRDWLTEHRIYFWGAFLGIAFLFSPDPTGMAPLIVAVTMVVLFEGTLLLLRWTGR